MSTYANFKQNNGKSKERILVPSDFGSRNIGEIKDGIFNKFNFQSSKHLCHKYRAIGLDKGAFHNYILPNAQLIISQDKDTDITYRISVSLFQAMAIEDDLGWGSQLFCPLIHWQADRIKKYRCQMQFSFGGETPW